uniref:Nucleolar protein putative n=1 Tax=Albugo laibachii Nc14 TaxID=890382 RepID=F0W1S0_9STRA|nr:nucleolar protein putative [Albugo laibachii Nc14]CCA25490.1 nucleolar protein putative [Albugo laibachii Nc14]|eukprot:CCA25490.1 nucleolar protein putative [Albugo laibachii Nc14]
MPKRKRVVFRNANVETRKKVDRTGSKNTKSIASASSISTTSNPFDRQGNARKQKYPVLGRKVKGQNRNVANARSKAETKRKNTLAKQYQGRTKGNDFEDRRIGEQDESLSLEEKMMARFRAERKRKLRDAYRYNLQESDDEEDELFLTHKNTKLDDEYNRLNNDNDQNGEDGDDPKDEEIRRVEKEIVQKYHFGGGNVDEEKDDNKPKSHQEIMKEVMLKAKMFKAERQRNKQIQEDVTEELDGGFDSIRSLLKYRPNKNTPQMDDFPSAKKAELDDFDVMAREFAFEAKAQATERKLKPEEIAQVEKDRLETLERKRLARMKGTDSDDDGHSRKDKKKKPPMSVRPSTDDDLGDNYEMKRIFGTVDGGDEAEIDTDHDPTELESDNEEPEQERSESEVSDESDGAESVESEEGEDSDGDEMKHETELDSIESLVEEKQSIRASAQAATELPYVFDCPQTLAELQNLFTKYTDEQDVEQKVRTQSQILERLLQYHSPKLSVANQKKIKTLMSVLLQLLLVYGRQYTRQRESMDVICKHLCILAQELPQNAGSLFREFVSKVYRQRLRGGSQECRMKRSWPATGEILVFRLMTHVFSISDLRHNVISPLETLIAECLSTLRLQSGDDVTQALAMCAISLEITKTKKRFCPEVIQCFQRILGLYICPKHRRSQFSDGLKEWAATNPSSLPTLSIADSNITELAPAILGTTTRLIQLATQQYEHIASIDTLMYPVYLQLHLISNMLPKPISDMNTVLVTLTKVTLECWKLRRPLRLQQAAPSILPTFTPKYDANYAIRKDKTLDRDKAKVKQLQRQVKRARKGAARELRRDAEFLAREKQQEEESRLGVKREKQKEIRSWMEEQNATFNQQVRKGGHMLKGGGSMQVNKTKKRSAK